MVKTNYLIALGSNQRHHRYGRPEEIVQAAIDKLEQEGIAFRSTSKSLASRPIGPSLRNYINSVAIIETDLKPLPLLSLLKRVEMEFGRRRGQRWSQRVLDLDIIMSANGSFHSRIPYLCIPHPAMRGRHFVLEPGVEIAPNWRDPLTGFTIQQLLYRLKRPKPLDPKQKRY